MINPTYALVSASALLVLLTSYSTPVDGYFTSADMLQEAWTATGTTVGAGNGAFMSPDGLTLAVISRDCTVTAYEPTTGTTKWTNAPTDIVECLGGLWFAGPYIAYSAVSGGARCVACRP